MKKFLSIISLGILSMIPFAVSAQESTGDLKASVVDEKGEAMPGAIVLLITPSGQKGAATDMDGNVTFRALNPGSYDLQTRVVGYKAFTKKGIEVNAGQTSYANFPMQLLDNDSEIVIYAERSPVDPKYSTVQNLNSKTIKYIAADRTNLLSMVTGTSSQVSEGPNGGLVMRGAREGASATYVDGEIMYGTTGVPAGSIEQVSILSGGIPASYGDVTGGIVIVTTKSYWDGVASKQDAIDAYNAEVALAKKQALEASGQHIENKNEIIENGATTTTPASGGTTTTTTSGGTTTSTSGGTTTTTTSGGTTTTTTGGTTTDGVVQPK